MRVTEFWERMTSRFGSAYADSISRDQVLSSLQGRTAEEALAAGAEPRDVWLAVCEAFDVPARER